MSSASAGVATGYSTVLVDARASVDSAAARLRQNVDHICQSGRKASVQAVAMKVAKASLSQIPSHQAIVTRLPNHMWASSWQIVSATRRSSGWLTVSASTSRSTSRKVTHPRFSMAPKAKSGRATRSSLSEGYGRP